MKRFLACILVLCNLICVPVWASEPEFLVPGSYVEFGRIYDEPILWRVISRDKNGYLLFSEKIVEVRAFDAATDTVREDLYRQTHGSNYWGTSALREWLNSEEQVTKFNNAVPDSNHVMDGKNSYDTDSGFLYEFTAEEKNIINSVDNKTYLSYIDCDKVMGGSAVVNFSEDAYDIANDAFYTKTNDKVFVLDREEFYENVLLRGFSYDREFTSKAAQRSRNNSLVNFWTRTPQGDNSSNVAVCEMDNEYYMPSYNAYNSEIGVVPALYVKTGNVLSGKGTISEPYILDTGNTQDKYGEKIEYAIRLTENAEQSMMQIDIDEAQTEVSKLIDGDEKTELMRRLDTLQARAEYAVLVDYSEKNEGDSISCGNNATGTIVRENNNLVAKIQMTDTRISGWGQLYTFNNSLTDSDFMVSQKIKYSGNISDGRIIIYAKPDNNHIFQVYTDSKTVVNSDFSSVSGDAMIEPDKWYNIEYFVDIENNKYKISITNAENGNIIFVSNEYDYKYNHKLWTGVQYIFEGKSADGSGCFFVDDLCVLSEDNTSEVRELVVAAERSFLKTDIDNAAKLIEVMESGWEKARLSERLSAVLPYSTAADAVAVAVETGLESDIKKAQNEINLLEDGRIKQLIQERLSGTQIKTMYENALALVNKAEQSKLQTDIDSAQKCVSNLTYNDERKKLENRLDVLQKRLDAVMYVDYSDKVDGEDHYFANRTTGSFVDEKGNIVAQIKLSQYGASGWGPSYSLDFELPETFKIEQKVKYSGNINEGRFFLYAQDGACHLYNVFTDNKAVVNSSWSDASSDVLKSDKWYNIIYSVNGNKYSISAVDAENNEIVYTSREYDYEYSNSDWSKLQYRFEGSTPDESGVIFVDDLVFIPNSPLIIARDAVVKAERSKLDEDIQAAYEAVSKLGEADCKLFMERIDNIKKIKLNATVLESSGEIKVILDVITGSNNPVDAQVIVALFCDDRLYSCKLGEKSITSNERVTANFEVENNREYTVKVFLWEDLLKMKPLSEQLFETVVSVK